MSQIKNFIVPNWPAPNNVRALQTTRLGGVSLPPFESLNLGLHVQDVPLAVLRNRHSLNTHIPAEPVWLDQVHGTTVANADAAQCVVVADACITTRRHAVCVVMSADCLPILLCDVDGTVVAAVHAGWRGLAAGVIEATVEKMQRSGANLMAWMGPAISAAHFEVGDEVRDIFVAKNSQFAAAFIRNSHSQKLHADLYALARLRLQAMGIVKIFGGEYCTYAQAEQFFSYRRDGMTGRMGTFIWLDYCAQPSQAQR